MKKKENEKVVVGCQATPVSAESLIRKAFDKKFGHLLQNGVIPPNDYYTCQNFAVNHPPKYHEGILRSLAIRL